MAAELTLYDVLLNLPDILTPPTTQHNTTQHTFWNFPHFLHFPIFIKFQVFQTETRERPFFHSLSLLLFFLSICFLPSSNSPIDTDQPQAKAKQ